MAEIDFQAMLDDWTASSSGSNPIESIYKIIPKYDNYQMKMLMVLNYFVSKWDLDDVRALFQETDKLLSSNRNLGFMSSKNLERLLAAYTQNEMIRGIKVNSFNDTSSGGGT